MSRKLAAFALALALGLFAGGCTSDDGSDGPQQPGSPADPVPGERVLRRLTRFEYDNTVHDLLHLDSSWGQTFPADDVVLGFDNNARALRVGPLLADKVRQAAEEIADAAGKDLGRLVPCDPNAGTPECAQGFIRSFGGRAFRRPLNEADVRRYLDLWTSAAAEGGFAEGVKLVITAMLQSPHFLYRPELGAAMPAPGSRSSDGSGAPAADGYRLTPFEIASELSYFLWGSMPDDDLLARAQAGGLGTPEQIAAEARRMLRSPRSRPLLDHFITQWLQLDRLQNTPKADAIYPGFTPEIRAAMLAETTALFDHVIRAGTGKLPELLTASYTLVPDGLAKFYGLPVAQTPPDAQGLRRTDLPPERSGLLTHGSILSTQANADSASPVHRGKLVRERFLCQLLPPPPAGLIVQLPAVDPRQSNRERFTAHSKEPACSSCHRLMDPIGFGFERFDGIGRYRVSDQGQTIDAGGEILSSPHTSGKFDGVADLQTRLAASPDVKDCFARQWFRFAYGIQEDDRTQELPTQIAQVADRFSKSELSIEELVVALTQVRRFTLRAADPDVAGGPVPAAPDGGSPPPPSPDMASPPPPAGQYRADVHRDSDWAAGYCATVLVTNTGAAAGEWTVTLQIEGTINNIWNAVATPAGGKTTFTGVDYNRSLAPGATTTFGFCAKK